MSCAGKQWQPVQMRSPSSRQGQDDCSVARLGGPLAIAGAALSMCFARPHLAVDMATVRTRLINAFLFRYLSNMDLLKASQRRPFQH